MPHFHIKMHSNHQNLMWEELLGRVWFILWIFIFIKHFCWLYLQKGWKAVCTNKSFEQGLKRTVDRDRNTIIWFEHKGFTPNLLVVWSGCWHTVQAQLDEWYHTVMCYNNTEPQEGVLQLLQHLQSPEENHLKKSYLKGFNAQMCNHYIKYLS